MTCWRLSRHLTPCPCEGDDVTRTENVTVERLLDRLSRALVELHRMGVRVAAVAEGDGWTWSKLLAAAGREYEFACRATLAVTAGAAGVNLDEVTGRKTRRRPPAARSDAGE